MHTDRSRQKFPPTNRSNKNLAAVHLPAKSSSCSAAEKHQTKQIGVSNNLFSGRTCHCRRHRAECLGACQTVSPAGPRQPPGFNCTNVAWCVILSDSLEQEVCWFSVPQVLCLQDSVITMFGLTWSPSAVCMRTVFVVLWPSSSWWVSPHSTDPSRTAC